MPRGKREQAVQIILKLLEAELELPRGKTVPEQPVAKVPPWPLATRKTPLFTGAALPAPHP
jgi:hypothetical protein